jgi:hypothetical protein
LDAGKGRVSSAYDITGFVRAVMDCWLSRRKRWNTKLAWSAWIIDRKEKRGEEKKRK